MDNIKPEGIEIDIDSLLNDFDSSTESQDISGIGGSGGIDEMVGVGGVDGVDGVGGNVGDGGRGYVQNNLNDIDMIDDPSVVYESLGIDREKEINRDLDIVKSYNKRDDNIIIDREVSETLVYKRGPMPGYVCDNTFVMKYDPELYKRLPDFSKKNAVCQEKHDGDKKRKLKKMKEMFGEVLVYLSKEDVEYIYHTIID